MPYVAEISRLHPTCLLFLIDQSGSMEDPFGGDAVADTGGGAGPGPGSKAQSVADALNRLLSTLVIRATKAEGVRHYFDVGVIGYGRKVGSAFEGPLAAQALVSVEDIYANPARVEERTRKVSDGAGGLVEEQFKLPIWFDAVAVNGTPMCAALRLASAVLEPWVRDHPASYPPIVINLTDGESTDGDPTQPAEALRSLATDDGNVLVLNCHLSSKRGPTLTFPDQEETLPDSFARRLFGMSSVLPEGLLGVAQREGFAVGEQARGFVFNGDLVDVIRFLDIGTRIDLR
ncbi:MAG TPA: vWA domain-containing protein [Chloroflexota bacterium]